MARRSLRGDRWAVVEGGGHLDAELSPQRVAVGDFPRELAARPQVFPEVNYEPPSRALHSTYTKLAETLHRPKSGQETRNERSWGASPRKIQSRRQRPDLQPAQGPGGAGRFIHV